MFGRAQPIVSSPQCCWYCSAFVSVLWACVCVHWRFYFKTSTDSIYFDWAAQTAASYSGGNNNKSDRNRRCGSGPGEKNGRKGARVNWLSIVHGRWGALLFMERALLTLDARQPVTDLMKNGLNGRGRCRADRAERAERRLAGTQKKHKIFNNRSSDDNGGRRRRRINRLTL